MGIYIDDGQNRHGYIKANPGLHDELRFDYRPCTGTDIMMFLDKCGGKNNVQIYNNRIKLVDSKLLGWEVDGEEETPASEKIKALELNLFTQLFSIIIGDEPTDDDPNATIDHCTLAGSVKN